MVDKESRKNCIIVRFDSDIFKRTLLGIRSINW